MNNNTPCEIHRKGLETGPKIAVFHTVPQPEGSLQPLDLSSSFTSEEFPSRVILGRADFE